MSRKKPFALSSDGSAIAELTNPGNLAPPGRCASFTRDDSRPGPAAASRTSVCGDRRAERKLYFLQATTARSAREAVFAPRGRKLSDLFFCKGGRQSLRRKRPNRSVSCSRLSSENAPQQGSLGAGTSSSGVRERAGEQTGSLPALAHTLARTHTHSRALTALLILSNPGMDFTSGDRAAERVRESRRKRSGEDYVLTRRSPLSTISLSL